MYTGFDASEIFYKVKASVQELVPLLIKYGIKGINPPAELLENLPAAREAAKIVIGEGLRWTLLPTPIDFLSEDISNEQFDEGIEKLKKWADVGQKIGVKYSYNHIFPGSNKLQYAENFEWHCVRIQQINNVMKNHGIFYGNEFLGPWDLRNRFKYPFIHTLAGQRALAEAIDPSIGFLFDTYHWYTGSESEQDDIYYATQNTSKMVCFHINDGVKGKGFKEQEDMIRSMPMTTGIIDSVTPYKMFKENGYTGPVLCEPMFPIYDDFRKMSAEDVVKTIASAYDKIEEASR